MLLFTQSLYISILITASSYALNFKSAYIIKGSNANSEMVLKHVDIKPIISLDLSGLDGFWAVVDKLMEDKKPDESVWNTMFEHPAYRQIQQNGNRCKRLREIMPLVFMPSKQDTLLKLLESGPALKKRIAQHLIEVKNHRDELNLYAKTMNFSDWISRSIEYVQNFAPKQTIEDVDFPVVYVILFEDNGFGYPNIVLDLLNIMQSDDQCNIRLIAHEAHHVYLLRTQREGRIGSDHPLYSVYNMLQGLHSEGMASMIDKLDWIEGENEGCLTDYQEEFIQAYQSSDSLFASINQILKKIANKEVEAKQYQLKGMMLWGGHANGMYMAVAIRDAKGEAFLADLFSDPFAFFRAYQEVAEAGSYYFAFDQEAVDLVKELESQN